MSSRRQREWPAGGSASAASASGASTVGGGGSSIINRTAARDELTEAKDAFAQTHGRAIMHAVLSGFASVAPRSATPNLVEVLSTLVTRYPLLSKTWTTEILFAVRFLFNRLVKMPLMCRCSRISRPRKRPTTQRTSS